MARTFLNHLRLSPSASTPTSPATGTLWYDSANLTLKVYNGTTWDWASDADITSLFSLTLPASAAFVKRSAAGVWSYDTNTYITGNQSITLSGDVTGTGTTAITATLANSGVTAGTYKSVTVNAKGLVTAGTNPTTISGYGITDAVSTSGFTMTGGIITATPSTTVGALRIPHGAALTTPVNGDIWTTTAGLFAYISGAQVGPYIAANQTITLSGDATGSGTTAITVAVVDDSHNHAIGNSITGLATGVATFLGTPTSANLRAAVTDETGSGALVFKTSPALTTPTISDGTDTTKTISFNLAGITTATNRVITMPDATVGFPTPVANAITVVSVDGTQTLTNKTATGLSLTAGTASVAPLKFNSGTSTSIPAAGEMEYDGSLLTFTPNNTVDRGRLPIVHAYRRTTDTGVITSNTTPTSIGAGLSVESSTTYRFKLIWRGQQDNATSSALQLVWQNAGTGASATYLIFANSSSAQTYAGAGIATTATSLCEAVQGGANRFGIVEGFITTGTGAGNLTPAFQSSVSLTTTGWTVRAGVYVELEKIPTGSAIISGSWV